MKIKIQVKDEFGKIQEYVVTRSYLAKFVDPDKVYPVTYTINHDGTRVNESAMLKGEDLTENQIAQLFAWGML
jgi:hypothetical protein